LVVTLDVAQAPAPVNARTAEGGCATKGLKKTVWLQCLNEEVTPSSRPLFPVVPSGKDTLFDLLWVVAFEGGDVQAGLFWV
jgi:hypothetical protein